MSGPPAPILHGPNLNFFNEATLWVFPASSEIFVSDMLESMGPQVILPCHFCAWPLWSVKAGYALGPAAAEAELTNLREKLSRALRVKVKEENQNIY